MKRIRYWFLLSASVVGVLGCLNEPEKEVPASDVEESSRSESLQDPVHWNVGTDDAQQQREGNSSASTVSSEVSIAADCVFIEWCNRPSNISPNIGTVCRVRPGCPWPPTAAIEDECTRDANAVCGGITQPAWICRQGRNCPPG